MICGLNNDKLSMWGWFISTYGDVGKGLYDWFKHMIQLLVSGIPTPLNNMSQLG